MILWFALLAQALPPDGTPALLPVGTGLVEDMDTSLYGDVVIGRDQGDKTAWLLWLEDWSTTTIAPCDNVLSVTWVEYVDFDEMWMGCENGELHAYTFDYLTGALSPSTYTDGTAVVFDVGASVDGLFYSDLYGYLLWIHDPGEAGSAMLHSVDPLSGSVDDLYGGEGVPLGAWNNFDEGVLVTTATVETLIVHHGGDNMSQTDVGTGIVVSSQVSAAVNIDDIAESWTGGVYGVNSAGQLLEYTTVTLTWNILLTGLNEPKGVAASLYSDDSWLVVTGGDVRVWELNPTTGGVVDPENPYFQGGEDNAIQDGIVVDGWFIGGGSAGNIQISTAKPWVDPASLSLSEPAATDGDLVDFTFSVPEAGGWEVYRGGDRFGTGDRLASGDVTDAEEITVTLEVDTSWEEGDNPLYVLFTSLRGETGHARLSLFVDNPPRPPLLTEENLTFGDGFLKLSFDGIPDEDLDFYDIYVTTTPFEPSDYPDVGGPGYDGAAEFSAPIVLEATGGELMVLDLAPLQNDVLHYVAVRATDQGGLVGPMSNVISATPRPTFGAAELFGETGGGPSCATSPLAAGWMAMGVGLLGMLRRRRGTAVSGALMALAGVALLGAPQVAHAQSDEGGLQKDLTPQRGNFELRYGGVNLNDAGLRDYYNETPANILQMEMGPSFFRMIEIDAGMGFFQELSYKQDAEGNKSGERSMLTWWPSLSLDGTVRLHLLDEQIIVPYIRGGFDYVIYSEKTDNAAGGKDVLRGAKFGNHMGLGASLLLDPFQRRRASLLEAQTGINDTYLTFEWRRQLVDQRSFPWASAPNKVKGFDFGAQMFTVGLKLDY